MPEEQLRARLCQVLRRETIPAAVWDALVAERTVSAAMSGASEDEFDDLVRSAKRYLSVYDSTRNKPAVSRPRSVHGIEHEMNLYEGGRAFAWSAFVARLARARDDVRDFRARVLNNRLLSLDEVWQLTSSPAARIFHLEKFLEHEVAVVGHDAAIVEERAVFNRSYFARVAVGPPTQEWVYSVAMQGGLWHGERVVGTEILSITPGDRNADVGCWPGSILDWLRKISVELNKSLAWPEAQAAWYVLTGRPPLIYPLHATGGAAENDQVVITVSNWVPAKTVAAFYRSLQIRSRHTHRRPPSSRSLDVFWFVEQRVESLGERGPWRSILNEWNVARPTQVYTDARRFARDYARAEAAMQQRFDRRSAFALSVLQHRVREGERL